MTRPLTHTLATVLLGAYLLYALTCDYLTAAARGLSLWYFALEVLLVATLFSSIVLLDRILPAPDLRAIPGIRALLGVAVLLVMVFTAWAAGAYLDELLGSSLTLGALLAGLTFTVVSKVFWPLLQMRGPAPSVPARAHDFTGQPPPSTPPN